MKAKTVSRKSKAVEILAIAKEHFGFESLRNGQQSAIEKVLAGQDTLVVQPTGSGKSAIYQIAGLMMDGAVVVVSPLIALQKDQRDFISRYEGKGQATVLNSTQTSGERAETLEALRNGTTRFVFLAPEQLAREDTREALAGAQISMMVVDEAHCISEWGHNFRPDYLQLGKAVDALGHPVVLALTATASARVRQEIQERLCMREAAVLVGGFDRPNLHLRVDPFSSLEEKREALLHRVQWAEKPGIVYVATRKTAESLMGDFSEMGVEALYYHGGMKAAERDAVQERFMQGDGGVMVATNAFGMGIDKSNIRFVYHFDAPESLDSYYQEIGRAGRDGERSEIILFFRDADIGAQAFHTGSGKAQGAEAAAVLQAFGNKKQVSKDELAGKTDLSGRKLTSVLLRLEEAGAVEMEEKAVRLNKRVDATAAVESVEEQQKALTERARERLEEMRTYAETTGCRRQHLLGYFGQEFEPPCGSCDVCEEAHTTDIHVNPAEGTRREVTA